MSIELSCYQLFVISIVIVNQNLRQLCFVFNTELKAKGGFLNMVALLMIADVSDSCLIGLAWYFVLDIGTCLVYIALTLFVAFSAVTSRSR